MCQIDAMGRKRVLVTGASRGIGRAIAVRLAEDGWDVAVHFSNSASKAIELVQSLGPRGSGAYQAEFDQPGAVKELWNKVERDGPLHAVVNNAGVYMPMKILETTEAEFEATYRKTFAINFEAPMQLCRLAAIAFASRGGGKVLNVASRVGFRGEAGAALYSASKAALINLTRALSVELASKNVQFYGIAPGWVETSMAREGMRDRLENIIKDIPMGRMASVEDCAGAAAYLLGKEADYMSGVVIDINGASYFH